MHDHVALLFVTAGRTTFELRERFEAREGDVVLVPAGAPHRRLAARDHAMWGVGFCAPCYAPSELAPLLDPFERARAGASSIVHIPADRQDYLARVCAELERETSAAHDVPYAALRQRSLLSLLLVEVSRAASTMPAADLQPSVVADALRFIERACLGPISLRDVAAAVRRSPAYVTTALKRATGKTAQEWIIAGRLGEARNRLLHGDERVDIIAERVGYADVTHFIRLFRREHGMTPAAWRRMQRSGEVTAASRRLPARWSARG